MKHVKKSYVDVLVAGLKLCVNWNEFFADIFNIDYHQKLFDKNITQFKAALRDFCNWPTIWFNGIFFFVFFNFFFIKAEYDS